MSDSFLGAAGARTRDAAIGGAAAATLPTDRGDAGRSTFAGKLAVGHQEIGRIVDELDQIYSSQPTEWLPMKHIGHMIANMWYEDIDEFEDAMGGTFSEFMHSMPHIEIRTNSLGAEEFKVVMPDPDAPPSVMTLRVETREDLWRVLFKSPDAKITISHLEFEVPPLLLTLTLALTLALALALTVALTVALVLALALALALASARTLTRSAPTASASSTRCTTTSRTRSATSPP